ncbi:hypothetical protein RU97_GL002048 [Enterococcus canis]|uniref:Copper ABC transporter permease n=1 Tax=Enterococcus canis TaxID=214095 RepID=A0A1L8RE56_9ENTE|nr:YfhO family protein [Enterococcus canis]OJG17975.1 hypothetical protein RU97_GL002048 [Enterococcus canis]
MKKLGIFLKKEGLTIVYSFAIPVIILALVYALRGIFPGDLSKTIMASDSYSQYSVFHAAYNRMIKDGESFFYDWSGSLGLNRWAFIAYYLSGIFTPLVLFFKNTQITDFLYFYTLFKFGLMGVSFALFLKFNFELKKIVRVALTTMYSLVAFSVATSEVVMWLDALIYLPLIIWGIHRLVDKNKVFLLFISYLLMFISNFYMAFIVGLFSFLYYLAYIAIDFRQRKRTIGRYLLTSFLAGGAAMPILLPVLFDLRNNGEGLSVIGSFKTVNTGWMDLLIKNMVGVYDSTKFSTIPFVYVGLTALIFTIFFFITKKICLREKIAYGSLVGILVLSFYVEPLNLFWQGMHTPNMFLFRYSFVFSFMVIFLAAKGLVVVRKEDFEQIAYIVVGLVVLFTLVRFITDRGEYNYLYTQNYNWTLMFLLLYLLLFYLLCKQTKHIVWLLLLGAVIMETGFNTFGLIRGIDNEWGYQSGEKMIKEYEEVTKLLANKETGFIRTENLTPLSQNDAFLYGYHGVAMFSSIRNRHSSQYLDSLGFNSRGTNLKIRYRNNTLLMDTILGIKQNLSKEDVLKYGYREVESLGDYRLFENQNEAKLGILTDEQIYAENAVENQSALFNQLASMDEDYFSFQEPKFLSIENGKYEEKTTEGTEVIMLTPDDYGEKMRVTYELDIPQNVQAYLMMSTYNYYLYNDANVHFKVNGSDYVSQVNEDGAFYSVGYFEEKNQVEITLEFTNLVNKYTGEKEPLVLNLPKLTLLDIEKYQAGVEAIQKENVDLKVKGRKVSGNVETNEERVLFTTIPYDQGWTAFVNGEKTDIPLFQEAFLTLRLPAGKSKVEFVYVPQGLKLGVVISLLSLSGFLVYYWLEKRSLSKGSSG